MKVAIIGAGNMGGAIARGFIRGTRLKAEDITVADPNEAHLEALSRQGIRTTPCNKDAVEGAELVIIAVKPWLVQEVIAGLTFNFDKQLIASVAAGISFAQYKEWLGPAATVFRLVPNTAISELQSMTLIASVNASAEQETLMLNLFNELGLAMLIPEAQIAAVTALTSCGIAYALKYLQAAAQAGVEMGISPKNAMQMAAQSMKGAAALILNNDTHPAVEIDKVTTPGGITIKGINTLEHEGFASAVIRAIKASV